MGHDGIKSVDGLFLQELTARNLRIILISAWWAFISAFLLTLIAGNYRVVVICFIGAVLTAGLLKMNHRGRTRAVGISSCLLFYLAGSTCLLIGEGFRDEAILVYPAIIIISSLLLNRIWFAVFALLSIGGVFAVGLAEIQGLIVHELSGYTRLTGVLTSVTILAVTTVGVRLLNRDLLNTIEQAKNGESKCRSLFDSSPDGIILTDSYGRIIDANARIRRLSGYSRSELTHRDFRELIPESRRDDIHTALRSVRQGTPAGLSMETETELLKKDGGILPVALTGWTVMDSTGRPAAFGAFLKDISDRYRTKAALEESEEKFRLISEQSLLGVVIIQHSVVQYCNAAACRLIGYPEAEVMAWGPSELMSLFHPEDRYFVEARLRNIRTDAPEERDAASTYRLVSQSGRTVWVDQYSKAVRYRGKPAMLISLVDISEKKTKEAEIAYLAYHDVLTGLPNRKSFYTDLEENLKREDRCLLHTKGAVLFLDLDNFKNVNESLGHDAGDALLKEISERLRGCLRKSDKIYRTGGDEFTVILLGLEKDYNVARVAEKINAAIAEPFRMKQHDLYVSGSIGISVFPDDGDCAEELIKNADMAMYEAKKHRKGYRFFTRRMNQRAMTRITLEKELRTAVEKKQFVMFYQPIADEQEIIRGMESLIRWIHPDKGIVLPGVFIPVLEDMGEILAIGQWVLYRSCAEVKTWNDRYGTALFVSVNVSALQLQDDLFVHTVEDALQRTGLKPELLKLEITESTIMKDPASVMDKIKILQARGVEFSIDDFGTGYSSLSYLRKLPFDTLKIDRSFVTDAVSCSDNREIIKTIISLSKALRKKTLAEGVETAAQKDLLKQLGCNQLQGYFFHKPMPAEAFEKEIIQWQSCN